MTDLDTNPDTSLDARDPDNLAISSADIEERRSHPEPTSRILFQVAGLYGISTDSAPWPVSRTETVESGQVSISLDPVADPSSNMGMIDYDRCYMRVRYGIQGIFPGLHELVLSGNHDLSLLGPVRAVATDQCQVQPDHSGWRALGCLDFMPGSLWAGASGG